MASIPPRQPSLAPLLKQLLAARLPCLAAEGALAMAHSPTVELRHLQSLAEHEPGLAVQVLRQVNSVQRADRGPRGLAQGIHLIGSGGVQRLLRGLQAQRYDADQPGHRLSLQAMATSRLAWLYLAHWLRSALASDEDVRLSLVTLMGCARWKIPLVAPLLAAEIERRVQGGERRTRVERELVGADLDTLNLWHLEDLGLQALAELIAEARLDPSMLAQAARLAWAGERAPLLPEPLQRSLRPRQLGCSLAYALALSTQVDWYSRRTDTLLRAVSVWMGRPLDETLRAVQRQALFASGEPVFVKDLRAPAVGLLWPPLPPRRAAAAKAPAPPGPPRSAHEAARPSRTVVSDGAVADVLAGYLARCGAGHADLRTLLTDSVQVFKRLGLQRCALFLRQPDGDRLGCYFSFGFPTGQADRRLTITAGERSFVSLLLAQPGSAFRVAPAQLAGLGNKLPPELAHWPAPGGLLLASVPVHGRVVGFWWADAGPQGEAPASESFSCFRRAAQAFGPAFTRQLDGRATAPS